MATETKLSENKDIKELLEALENHGLSKEKNEFRLC